ncbi:MAG: hypothetical protein ACPGUZ_03570 [Holosporaceae bacterium]
MMRRVRQKQLNYIAFFLLALCGANGLWAPGPGDDEASDEASAAPTLKRKRSDDEAGPAPKEAASLQPERPAKKILHRSQI